MNRTLSFLLSLLFCYSLATQSAQALEVDLQVLRRLVTISEGLSIENLDIRLGEGGDGLLAEQAIRPSEKIEYVFEKPTGFKLLDGKASFDISLQIHDSAGELIKEIPSLYGDIEPSDLAELISLTLTLDPQKLGLEVDQSYLISLRLSDKNSQHYIEAQHRLSIQEDVEHPEILMQSSKSFHYGELEVTEQGLEYQQAYVMDRASLTILEALTLVTDQKVSLVIEGLSGFSSLNEKVFPVFEMTVLDQSGETVYFNPDLMAASATEGIEKSLASKALSANLIFHTEQPAGRYLWGLRIYDRFGNGQIGAKAWMTLKSVPL